MNALFTSIEITDRPASLEGRTKNTRLKTITTMRNELKKLKVIYNSCFFIEPQEGDYYSCICRKRIWKNDCWRRKDSVVCYKECKHNTYGWKRVLHLYGFLLRFHKRRTMLDFQATEKWVRYKFKMPLEKNEKDFNVRNWKNRHPGKGSKHF